MVTITTAVDFLQNRPWIDLPEADIGAFCGTYAKNVSFNLASKLSDWRRNGVVVFEQVVPHELIDAFCAELDEIRSDLHRYLLPIEIRGEQTWTKAVNKNVGSQLGVKFNHLHVSSAHAARLSLVRPVVEFLEAIFGSPVMPTQSLTFLLGSQQPTHIDYPYVRQQRRLPYMAASWIPLEDIHPEAGPLGYFAGGHDPGVSGFFDWGHGDILSRPETRVKNGMEFARYLDERMKAAGIEPSVFLPRKGDVLIWHCNLPHQGTRVRNPQRTRKSYVTHYTGFTDYPARWLLPESVRPSRTITENGGLVMDFPWSKLDGKLPSWNSYFLERAPSGT